MHFNLTRQELYDLVWSKPKSQLAEELGIASATLTKFCKERDVPMPPHGYWLSSEEKQASVKQTPLPMGVFDLIVQEHADFQSLHGFVFDAERIDEEPSPRPVFTETPEQAVARYARMAAKVPIRTGKVEQHPIVVKLLHEDARRRLNGHSYYDRPEFDTPEGRELLAGINTLLWLWQDLGFRPSHTGIRYIITRIEGVGPFKLFIKTDTTLGPYGAVKRSNPRFALAWQDDVFEIHRDRTPLMTSPSITHEWLRVITKTAIAKVEERHRTNVDWHYDWEVRKRNDAMLARDRAREREEQRRAEEAAALIERRENLLTEAIEACDRADQLRALVASFDEKFRTTKRLVPSYKYWRSWVLQSAHDLDLRSRSVKHLDQWFAKFKLRV